MKPPLTGLVRHGLAACRLLEHQAVLVLQQHDFTHEPEAGGCNLVGDGLSTGPHMPQYPGWTYAIDALKVDHDHPATGAQRPVEGGHRPKGELEVVVGVADEGQIDGRRW